jgi:hypothetical protein
MDAHREYDATVEGVKLAMLQWLREHTRQGEVPELLRQAVRAAVEAYLYDHPDSLRQG